MPRSLGFYVHASHTCEEQRLEHAEPLVHHHLDAQLHPAFQYAQCMMAKNQLRIAASDACKQASG